MVILLGTICIDATSSPAKARLQVSSVWPQLVQLHPGEDARFAISGQELDLLERPEGRRGEALAPGLQTRLGAKQPSLRDLFVSVGAGVAPGDYGVVVTVGSVLARLPVIVRVISNEEFTRRNLPYGEPSADFLRRQRETLLGGVR